MSIKINNVVNVDFEIVSSKASIGAFDTTVYITSAPLLNPDDTTQTVPALLCDSIDDVIRYVQNTINTAHIIHSAKMYFNNGGTKLLLVNPSQYTLAGFTADIETARTKTDNFIYVTIAADLIGTSATQYTTAIIQEIAEYCDTTAAPEKIRLCLTTASQSFIADNNLLYNNVAVKYCTKLYNTKLIDEALLIGAYFSQIDLDGSNTIKDYCYTEESVITTDNSNVNGAAEGVTQTEFNNLVNNPDGDTGYYNFIDKIGNKICNFGGNYANVDGIAIHTDFGAIAVEKDITYSTLELMIGKQYLTDAGLSNISAAINNQLQRYKSNGYLNIGAKYSGSDLKINYNGKSYLVVKSDTTLSQGFIIYTIPISNISVTDKANKKFTPIFVVLETQSGARVVQVNGEVRA